MNTTKFKIRIHFQNIKNIQYFRHKFNVVNDLYHRNIFANFRLYKVETKFSNIFIVYVYTYAWTFSLRSLLYLRMKFHPPHQPNQPMRTWQTVGTGLCQIMYLL